MTPEEQALQEYMRAMQMQNDPFARATNDYGQGAGFLQLDDQPESWDRVGEKNDVYGDLFRMTQTYLKDYIPDLNPEVEDPGQFEGYVSDKADLYRNNPAYAQLEAFMSEGASFDEAVQLTSKLAADRPEIAAGLPQYEGRPDTQAFRNSAETYVSERAREGREYDQHDAQRQAYDDFVRPQTGWDRAPGIEDITTKFRDTNPVSLPRAAAPESLADLIQARSRIDSSTTDLPPAKVRAGIRSANDPKQVERAGNNKAYNKALQASYDSIRGKKEAIQGPSKKQENNMKLVRAYNMLMYGE